MIARVAFYIVALAAIARGQPPPIPSTPTATDRRVVLADADPELRLAVEKSLRPWRIEVVIEPSAPSDLASAQIRADQDIARFVVWREGDELVVYDRQSGVSERRQAGAGRFDAIGASAAALTVKTMMRLPPLPPEEQVDTVVPPPPAPPIGLSFDASMGARYEHGLDDTVALRFGVRAMVAPFGDGWRFGAVGDFGAAADVAQASFKGGWSNWAVLAAVGYAIDLAPWQLEPWIGAGAEHSDLSGTEAGDPRQEARFLLALRGGAILRYPIGAWRVGAALTIETLASTQTYTKLENGNAQVFEIPPLGVVAGVTIGAEL